MTTVQANPRPVPVDTDTQQDVNTKLDALEQDGLKKVVLVQGPSVIELLRRTDVIDGRQAAAREDGRQAAARQDERKAAVREDERQAAASGDGRQAAAAPDASSGEGRQGPPAAVALKKAFIAKVREECRVELREDDIEAIFTRVKL